MIFDENLYAKEMFKVGFRQSKGQYRELQILANYLRSLKMDEKEIESTLHSFSKKFLINYNQIKMEKQIDKLVKASLTQKNKSATHIVITQKELDVIMREENIKVQKLLFIYLSLAKYFESNYHNNKYYVGIKDSDLWKLCKFYTRKEDRMKLLNYITIKDYIRPTLNNSSSVNYVEDKSKIILNFVPCENMIYYFEQYLGAKVIFCDKCGIIEKPHSNSQKYCKKCAKLLKNNVKKCEKQ